MSKSDQIQQQKISNGSDNGKINPRSDYSMDEIKNILSGIDSVLSDHKAKMQGIDPENMIKTIRGGRVVWITKDEMNDILKKKQRVINKNNAKNKPKNDKVSSEINHRIFICKSIVAIVRKIAKDKAAHLIQQFRKIEYYQNLSITRSNDIRVIDSAIQQKKQQDPVLQEAEAANQRLLNAVKSLDTDEIEIQQNYRERHMDDFLYKEQRLEPYYRKLKEYREEFIDAKHHLLKRQFQLIHDCLQIIKPYLNDLVYHDQNGETADTIITKYKELNKKLSLTYKKGYQFFNADEQNKIDIKELQQWDHHHFGPLINHSIEFMSLLLKVWKKLVDKEEIHIEKKETIVTPKTTEKVSRMTFPNK